MSRISQKAKYRESMIKYAKRFGIQEACVRFNKTRSYIYRWKARYEASGGDIRALEDISRQPHHSPSRHSEEEELLIRNLLHRNPNIGLHDLYFKMKQRGYSRSISGLYKAARRMGLKTTPKSNPSPTCRARTFEPMKYPGERIQIDVKYVPKECLDKHFIGKYPGERLYQYTAIDEYSRLRILEGYQEHNTYSSADFLRKAVSFYKAHGIEVKCVQTDNGFEFTSRLGTDNPARISLFELTANVLNIQLKHIKPHTPKHNGKVERSHREDQKLFYTRVANGKCKFSSLTDYQSRLKRYQKKTNNRPMKPLGYLSPLEYLERYKHKLS